jgi:CheY-like chemotaxis protein
MPGIDGWEALRRLRLICAESGRPLPPAAIVSANAFDRALDNDVGIRPADFLVKPVRLTELLDWLERRLQLQWTLAEPAVALTSPASRDSLPIVYPSLPRLAALEQALSLGHLRGVRRQLDEIEQAEPAATAWIARLRELAGRFQLDALQQQLATARAAASPSENHPSPR